MSVFIRIHWLPSGFNSKITAFLKDDAPFLTVLDVKSEKWEEGKSSIENGVYSVKVSYDIDDHDNFLNFAGFHRVEGLGALIQINGAGSKCLQCNKWGHVRKDCPNAKTKCASCNKTGHNASSCWVSKAKNNNNDEIQNEMEFENLVNEQDDEIKFVGGKKNLLNSTNKPFKVTTQDSIHTVEIKKELISENCEKVTKTIDSVVEKAMAAPMLLGSNLPRQRSFSNSSNKSNPTTPLITSSTFDKIKNSANNNNNKSSTKKKNVKPAGVSDEDWKVELKRLKAEDAEKEKKREFIAMNAAALSASRGMKRVSSKSNVNSENKAACKDPFIDNDDQD